MKLVPLPPTKTRNMVLLLLGLASLMSLLADPALAPVLAFTPALAVALAPRLLLLILLLL